MKRIFIIMAMFICLFAGIKVSAKSLQMSIPEHQIDVNGKIVENTHREYPFIQYNDILYFPLSHNLCSFVGLETYYGKKGYNENSPYLFYVGKSDQTSETFSQHHSNFINKPWDVYEVCVVEYDVYIQNEKYGGNEKYPIVNFRGITYIPLVWNVATKLLDWDYSFDGKTYVINTEKAVRPKLNYMALWSTSPHGGIKGKFLYGKNFYIQYPGTIFGEVVDFIYRSSEKEVKFNLKEELYSLGITALGTQKAPDLYSPYDYIEHIPLFDGRYFVLICRGDKEEHFIIKIDMLEGIMISAEKI